MIETVLMGILKNDAAITAIAAGRVYPVILPQGAVMPALVYQQISSSEPYTCSGPVGLIDIRFQITCWAASHNQVVNLAAAVKNALSFYRSTTEGIEGTRIESIGDISYIGSAEAQSRYGKYVDVTISYKEQ